MIFAVKATCIKEVIKDKQLLDIVLDIPTKCITDASKIVDWITFRIANNVSDYKIRHLNFNIITLEKGSKNPFVKSRDLTSYMRYFLRFECGASEDVTDYIIEVFNHGIEVFKTELIYSIQKQYFLSWDAENNVQDSLVKECILNGYSKAISAAEALDCVSHEKFKIPSVIEIELESVLVESARVIENKPMRIQSSNTFSSIGCFTPDIFDETCGKDFSSMDQNNTQSGPQLECRCTVSLNCELNFNIKTT